MAAESTSAAPSVSVSATPSRTVDPVVLYAPEPDDFEITVKVLKKQCFGSAGCNVTYRIDPSYVGTMSIPDAGTTEVTYEVKGGEDPQISTFTIEDGTATFDSEERLQTSSSKAKLTAKVTDVTYQP